MTLDLLDVAAQLPALVERVAAERARLADRLQTALRELAKAAADPEALTERLRAARTKWPLALPMHEPPDQAYPAPEAPAIYTAIATDGSHIDVDRHAPVDCFVLNLGWAVIRYGDGLPPDLAARAELQPTSAALTTPDEEDASATHALRGETLSLLRGVRELARLAELVAAEPTPRPTLALLDGNLGLWNVSQVAIPAALRERLIHGEGGMRPALDLLRDRAATEPLAFGAYTSRPGTSDVAHALRVAHCPLTAVDCSRCPGLGTPERPCDAAGVGLDADLFWALLRPGERSAVFRTWSRPFLRAGQAPAHWYEEAGHDVAFFYLRLEDEVARVETPIWTAESPERLALLHALTLDQCGRGPGYPVTLQESHEAAVISGADRRAFADLLERELYRHGLEPRGSAKRLSKTRRGV